MNALRKYFDKIKPNFEEGGKLHAFRSLYDGFETFAFVPNTTAGRAGTHVHDAIDSKRIMSLVVIALVPALLFGMYNVGYQNALAAGQLENATFWGMFWFGFLAAHATEVNVIPEGDDNAEMLGWIMPRLKEFSTSRSYFSWLKPKKTEYTMDARIKGGERHMIMSGEYDRVFPMDIYAGYLVKAIISGDIDRQEALGIYEVAPEDFALAEFVDSSKLELQRIVREGLDILRKENA
jgi:hypothetical protein